MTRTTDRFPSSLPNWIREWATECRDGKQPENDDTILRVLPGDIDGLWRILSSPEVALNLERLDCGKSVDDRDHQNRVLGLLSETLFIYQMSKRGVFETPSRQKEKLRRLAQDVARVAATIESFKDFLGPALNVRYLQERLASVQSTCFVRNRMGLGAPARFPTNGGQLILTKLLVTFSEDVREELSSWPKRIDLLYGGEDAPIRFQIKRLKESHRQLFGRDNNRLISSILSAINEKDIQEERVKKTALRGKNLR